MLILINYTHQPIIRESDPELLHDAIKNCINEAVEYSERTVDVRSPSSYESITADKSTCQFYMKKFYVLAVDVHQRVFGVEWILECFKYVNSASQERSNVNLKCLLGECHADYRQSGGVALRRGLWLVLVLLFKAGKILLSADFKALQMRNPTSADRTLIDYGFALYPELMWFCISARYKNEKSDFWQGVDKKICERVAQYGTRLFFIIGARTPEEINCDSIIDIHKEYYYLGRKGVGEIPVKAIMEYVCHYYQGRVKFTYLQFLGRLNELRLKNDVSIKHRDNQEVQKIDVRGILDEGQLVEWCKTTYKYKFRFDSICESGVVPSTAKVDSALSLWISLQKKYFEIQRYENLKSSSAGVTLFNLYLFGYLPRWYNMYGDLATAGYPSSVQEFDHVFFVQFERSPGAPMSLLHFLGLITFEQKSIPYVTISQLDQFFDWVEKRTPPTASGTAFRNLLTKSDRPSSNSLQETDKRPFTKSEYPIALNYLSRLFEALRLINNEIFIGGSVDFSVSSLYKLAISLGWKKDFYIGGRKYSIAEFPSMVFRSWAFPSGGQYTKIIAPHMVVHLLAALDSGARHQSIQWLCVNFDKYVSGDVPSKDAQVIWICTDKTKADGFDSVISSKTLEALKYQKRIRGYVGSDVFDAELHYNGNSRSKKDMLVPLFSWDCNTGMPFSDAHYSKTYRNFLVVFQSFFAQHGFVKRFYEMKPYGFAYGEKVITSKVEVIFADAPYCRVRVVTDMTPHHTRSSSVRVWCDHMSDRDTGLYKSGQAEETVRYYKPMNEERIAEIKIKMTPMVESIWSGIAIDTTSPASNFRIAINERPNDAIADFNCITVSMRRDNPADGIEMIRQNRHSGLAFHATHICARNNQCTDSMKLEGLEYRCGLCAFAVKGLDHLEAIDVKIFDLSEEVRYLHSLADSLSTENQHDLERIDSRLEICTADLLAWTWSRDVLITKHKDLSEKGGKFISYCPEVLMKSISEDRVSVGCMEYVLSRLYQVGQYPSLQSDVLRSKFNMLRIALMGNRHGVVDLFQSRVGDPVGSLINNIKSMMKVGGITISQLCKRLDEQESIQRFDSFEPLLVVVDE